MRPPLLILGFYSLTLSTAAQQPDNTSAARLSALRTFAIQLNNTRDPVAGPASSPFSHFTVLDERPDTARIGVHGNLPMRSHAFDRQLVFTRPASQEIASWLNRHFTSAAGAADSALVILRYLWLSDTDPYTPNPDAYATLHPVDPAGTRTHIRLKAEIYARRNNLFLPLLRVDTLEPTNHVVYNTLKSTYYGWDIDLETMLRDLAENAVLTATTKTNTSSWISWEEIRRYNRSRFDIPILDSSNLTRGVYTGFEEFRNNAPSIHDFEVRPEDGHFALYLRNSDGTSYYTHNVWGYCNGKQIFIMRDGLLHLVRKDGNSFYFYGVTGYPEQHCLYIIDMDTGQFY